MKKLIITLLYLCWSIAVQSAYPVGFTWRKTINGVQTAFTAISTDYKCAIGIAWVSTERTGSPNIQDQTEIGAGISTDFQGQFVIPSFLSEEAYQVTEIGYKAFYNCEGITSIHIPNSITYIDWLAFRGCKGLQSVTIPGSVTEIDGDVFSKCTGLKNVELNTGLKKIGEGAFRGCPLLTTIDLPSSLESIGSNAFSSARYLDTYEYCKSNLSTVIVHWDVPITISDNTFENAPNAKLHVPHGSKILYENASGWKNFKEIIEEDDVTISTYILSVKAKGNGFVSYGDESVRNTTKTFAVNEGTSATITFTPDSGYRVASLYVNSNNVTSSISNNKYTISNISNNTTIEVEFEVIPITTEFEVDGLKYKILSNTDNVKVTGKKSNYTGTIVIPDNISYQGKTYSVTRIDEDAFWGEKDITSLIIPKSITYIDDGAFEQCDNINSVYISSLESWLNVGLGDSWSNPLNGAYHLYINGKEFNEIVIPEGTTVLDDYAFCGFLGLQRLTLPSTLKILYREFQGCRNLSFVKSNAVNPPDLDDKAVSPFANISSEAILQVPKGSKDAYMAIYVYKSSFQEIIEETAEYTLSIMATGNGSASYNSTTIRSKTSSFTVNEGTSATITFTSDNGYRIASLYVNSNNVTSGISNNKYTINNISRNTTVEVTFEAIPPTTYTLSIKSTGSGSASYNSTTIRGKTTSFTVNEGTSAAITFTPDNGYRIASLYVNSNNVTSFVLNNKYTINNISRNTTVEVTFEAIPVTTYTLSIKSTGGGAASYNGTTIRSKTSSFTVNEGTSVPITLTPDNGYRIKSVKENNTNVTSYVSNSKYTINSISRNTTVEVEFEEIPAITYTLSITSTGGGYAYYNSTTIRSKTSSFTVNDGSSVTVYFYPDNGYQIARVKLNNSDVTAGVSNNSYTINNIKANTALEVAFEAMPTMVIADGVNYNITSQTEQTVSVANGSYGQVLTVPATVTGHGKTWTVTGIEANALSGNTQLAAVIWNPEVAFTATVSNPNLLLYVKAERYAPSAIQNMVVNGTANSIVLTEAQSSNNFYCPQTFTARRISYTHNYKMTTGIGESRGWETIALPFDVQTITHATKGEIVPFANWISGNTKKPFWLYQLTGSGFKEADAIKAYTPYIISMPNNSQYGSEWLLNGSVTFSATNVTIHTTDNVQTATYSSRTFVPNYADRVANEGLYALNVVNDFVFNNSGMTEGSKFVLNMRQVHPFEAYMTSSSNARTYFDIFDDLSTDIKEEFIMHSSQFLAGDRVFDLQGRKVEHPSKKGVYIVNGKKMVVK